MTCQLLTAPTVDHTHSQLLEEPGADDERYNTLQLPLVRPPSGATSTSSNGWASPSPWEHPLGEEEELEGDELQLGILKQFTFSSELQVTIATHVVM